MLKDVKKKQKSKSTLLADKTVLQNLNFKSGAIILSSQKIRCLSLKKINDIAKIPEPGEQIRIATEKEVNSFDFILSVLANSEKINRLIIAFYRISKKAIIELKELQKNEDIGSIVFLINDGFPKLVPDAYNLLSEYKSPEWEIKLAHNHTKIILIETDKDNHYVIEGSGNLSHNARIEQYLFENNKEVFDFHKNWIINL